MILAAGFGSRLQDLTKDSPKPLLQIHGHYLIEYPLKILRDFGCKEVIINTHYHAEKMHKALGRGERYGLSITYSFEPAILGTGGGIKKAEKFLGDETFVVINSDIVCAIDLESVLRFHRKNKADATMVVREDSAAPNHDEIKLTDDFRINSIHNLPPGGFPARFSRMFAGIHIIEPVVFGYLQERFSSIITDFYQPAIAHDRNIFGFDFKGYWKDIGNKEVFESVRLAPPPFPLSF